MNTYFSTFIVLFIFLVSCQTGSKNDDKNDSTSKEVVKKHKQEVQTNSNPATPTEIKNKNKEEVQANEGISTPKEIWKEVQVKAQKFDIDPTQTTKITGEQGTYLEFEANTFVHADGALAEGKITLDLKEYYQKADMLIAGLTTISNGRILKSAGMVHLQANTPHGKPLQIKSGKRYKIGFPKKGLHEEGMQLFYGKKANNQMNWIPAEKALSMRPQVMMRFVQNAIQNQTDAKTRKELDKLYSFQSEKLQWLNCDAFYKLSDNQVARLTLIPDQTNVATDLILHNYNIVLSGEIQKDGRIVYPRIPSGWEVVVMSVKSDKNGFYFDAQKILLDKDKEVKISLEKTTASAAKKKIEDLLKQPPIKKF